MGYRDENEALRHQVRVLEERLEQTQDELAKVRRKRDPKFMRGRIRRAAIYSAAGVGALAAMGMGLVLRRSAHEARALDEAPRPLPPIATPAPVTPPPAPAPVVAPPAPEQPPPGDRAHHARWRATVVRATGVALAPGAACFVRADVSDVQFAPYRRAQDDWLDIECDGQRLYRWTDPVAAGIEQRECAIGEFPVGDSNRQWRYQLRCADRGARRGGRPLLELDTTARRATLSREGDDPMRVELEVEPLSAVRQGYPAQLERMRPGPVFRSPVARTGRVMDAQGAPSGVRAGARCTVDVTHVPWRPQNCRVVVRCGSAVVYGRGTAGRTTCTVEGDEAQGARDASGTAQDGDPALTLDLRAGRVEVVDESAGARPWSVSIALDPATTPAADAGAPSAAGTSATR